MAQWMIQDITPRTEDTLVKNALWERGRGSTSAGTASWAERMLHSPADAAASEQSPRSGLQQTLPSTAEAAEALEQHLPLMLNQLIDFV